VKRAAGSALAASASTAIVRSIGAARRAASAIVRISSEYLRRVVGRERIDDGDIPRAACGMLQPCPFRRRSTQFTPR